MPFGTELLFRDLDIDEEPVHRGAGDGGGDHDDSVYRTALNKGHGGALKGYATAVKAGEIFRPAVGGAEFGGGEFVERMGECEGGIASDLHWGGRDPA